MKNNNLTIESVSNGPLFGQTFNIEMLNSLPLMVLLKKTSATTH